MGDFNGDGNPDTVWQDQRSNKIAWTFSNGYQSATGPGQGNQPSTYTVLSNTVAAGWKVVGVGDFPDSTHAHGDGQPDFLLQYQPTGQMSVWIMHGTTRIDAECYYLSMQPNGAYWKVAGVGDFDGNGTTDILLQDQNTDNADPLQNKVTIWYLNSPASLTGAFTSYQVGAPTTNPAVDWRAVGVADMNGDSHPDIVLQNLAAGQTTNIGQIAFWYMNNATLNGSAYVNLAPGSTNWKIAGLADMNADSHPDLVFQNQSTGVSCSWLLNGASETGSFYFLDAFDSTPSASTVLTQITLTWGSALGATGYNVKRSTVNGGPYGTIAPGVTSTSYTDTNLTRGITYYYVITALNSNSESYESSPVSKALIPLPDVPAQIFATAGDGWVSLAWAPCSGATSYNVKRSTVTGGPYATLDSGVISNGDSDHAVIDGTTYFYVVSAVNAGGESANSNQVYATPIALPSTPTSLTATRGDSRVSLSWIASTGATSYHIKRSTVAGSGYATLPTDAATTSFTNTGLANGTTYYFVVSGVNTSGQSGNSNEASATPEPTPASIPSGLTAWPGDSKVWLTWNADTNATYFNVLRGTEKDGPYPVVATVSTNSFTDTGLTDGVTYYYAITALGYGGWTSASSIVSATPNGPTTGLRINAGNMDNTPHTDSQGNTWQADSSNTTLFSGGTDIPPVSSDYQISNTSTNDATLFRTQRVGSSFSYNLPTTAGIYTLTLLLAEVQANGPGQRVFDVTVDDKPVPLFPGVDIYQAAGGSYRALVLSSQILTHPGTTKITFTGTTGEAAVAGISLVPGLANADVVLPPWAQGSEAPFASGVQEVSPGPDLTAYNPNGPSVSYERMYRGTRAVAGYASPGHSAGWTDNYDSTVTPDHPGEWRTLTLTNPNGSTEKWTPNTPNGNPDGTFSHADGTPYLITGEPSSTHAGRWNWLMVHYKNRSKYTYYPLADSPDTYALTTITNLVGHYVTINRGGSTDGYRISNITDDTTPISIPLLTFTYLSGQLYRVTDPTGRFIQYGFDGQGNLHTVSTIDNISRSADVYGYEQKLGLYFLNTVGFPDPSSTTGYTTNTTYYDAGQHISYEQERDAHGRKQSFVRGNGVVNVQVNEPKDQNQNGGQLTQKWTQKFDPGNSNVDTGTTNAKGGSESLVYTDPLNAPLNKFMPKILVNPNNESTSVTYDSYGNVTSMTDPRGVTTTNGWTDLDDPGFALGQLYTSVTSGLGTTTIHHYGPSYGVLEGLVEHVDSPAPMSIGNGATVSTAFTYVVDNQGRSLGNVATVTKPDPNGTTIITYNYTTDYYGHTQSERLGEPLKVTVTGSDNKSTATYFTYDVRGNRTAVIEQTEVMEHGFAVPQTKDLETDYTYNDADQIQTVTYPPDDPTYPDSSNPTRITKTYNYLYTGGPLIGVVTSGTNGSSISYSYGPEGELLSVGGDTEPATYGYDGLYRVISLADGKPNLSGVNNNTTYFAYDEVGNLTNIAYPMAGLTTDTVQYKDYDPAGHYKTRIDGNGVTTKYDYNDPESLLTDITYPGQQIGDVHFHYDAYGRRDTASDGTGSKGYSYDNLGNPLTQTTSFAGGPSGTLAYSYNHDGSRQTMLAQNAWQFNYYYDGLGQLTGQSVPGNNSLSYSYTPNGLLKTVDGDAHKTTYSYNGRGLLGALTNQALGNSQNPGWPVVSTFSGQANSNPMVAMPYDANGNRLTVQSVIPAALNVNSHAAPAASRNQTFVYNSRSELTQEWSTPTGNDSYYTTYDGTIRGHLSFGYDNAFNAFSVNADNQFGGTFDGNGNQTSGDFINGYGTCTTYHGPSSQPSTIYDPENRLTIAGINCIELACGYDGDGLRAWKTSTSLQTATTTNTYFLYDGDDPILEMDQNGIVKAINGYAADGIRSRYNPTDQSVFYYTFDPQGNLVQRLYRDPSNGVTSVLDTAMYDAFGKPLRECSSLYGSEITPADETAPDPVGFGGQHGYYTDPESNLVLMTHRYYNPSERRFITRDPIGYKGGINLYGFCGNNPVMRSDPEGLDSLNDYADIYAGWGDTLTFGATKIARKYIGI